MAKRWQDLSGTQRKLIVTVGLVETALKIAMLLDLRKRQDAQVHGSKRLWALSALTNSAGIIPLAYFLVGRRSDGAEI
jgi:hypothetical protein